MEQNKKVWIRGNKTRYKEVIAKLVALGASDTGFVQGFKPDWIYFIDDKNRIDGVQDNTKFAKSVMKEYQEIKLDDKTILASQVDLLNIQNGLSTFTKCITFPKGTNIKICSENGNMMVIVEPKEVKEEGPKFKKGDVVFLEVQGDNKIYQHLVIVKNADKDSIYFHVDLCLNENELTLPKGDYWFSNVDIKSIRFATEEEKRTLFLAMLNKGLFWDENKMKVRTLKDGDIITVKDIYNYTWYSVFKEIKGGGVYCYSNLTNNGKLCHEIGFFGNINNVSSIRYSITKERQTLFDKIEEKEHKKWNAETKEFENIRWRANKDEKYWLMYIDGKIDEVTEANSPLDDNLHSIGNYFQTKGLAEEARDKIKGLLSKL